MVNKEIVIKNFSEYASIYDRYASMQRHCADQLIKQITREKFGTILDIGCGTGYYTKLLGLTFPNADITAMDFSQTMLDVAKKHLKDLQVKLLLADAESFHFSEKYDLITSNVSFQWFNNLGNDFEKYRRHLKPNGTFLFSMFGPKTFYELNESLQELLGKTHSVIASEFKDKIYLENNLKQNFSSVDLKESLLVEQCDSINALFQKIKYTGARGKGIDSQTIWTPGMLKSLEEIYRKKFKSITVTYHVFWGIGRG